MADRRQWVSGTGKIGKLMPWGAQCWLQQWREAARSGGVRRLRLFPPSRCRPKLDRGTDSMTRQGRETPEQPKEKRVGVADTCRHLAERVDGVIPAIVSSFISTDPNERACRAMDYTNRLLNDASPFLTWLERNKHAGVANLEKGRIFRIADEAVGCATSDQPQFAGGKFPKEPPTARLTADQ